MMRSVGLAIMVSLVQYSAALHVAQTSRRALLIGGAASSLHSLARAPPAAALSGEELVSMIQGAQRDSPKEETSEIGKVISKAVRNKLIDPDEMKGCVNLESISTLDMQVADNVRIANKELFQDIEKLKEDGKDVGALKSSLKIGSEVEQLIGKRAMLFQDRFITQCVPPSS